jgi:hypothetical protein
MGEYDLFAAWFRVAAWAAYDLSKEGSEGIVLKPLAQYSKASTLIVRSCSTSENHRHRKLAASLAGWIQQPPLDLLALLFQQEVEQDRQMAKGAFGRLETQSVVEDIVFSAAFWVRSERTRPAAFELLRSLVERTIAGGYWNTAGYAITTLCQHQALGCGDLLNRFQQFATTAKVDHPSNPSLTQEQAISSNLVAQDRRTLDAIEAVLNQREEAATSAELDQNSRNAIEDLVKFAEGFEAA